MSNENRLSPHVILPRFQPEENIGPSFEETANGTLCRTTLDVGEDLIPDDSSTD